jgi:hypothetical protein
MSSLEDLERQMAAMRELAESIVEVKLHAKTHATLMVQVKMLELMVRKNLIEVEDIDAFIKEIEAGAAVMSKIAPETASATGDLALQLRNALLRTNEKPN